MCKKLAMLVLTGVLTAGSVTFQVPYTANTVYAKTVEYDGSLYDLDVKAFSDMQKVEQRMKEVALNGGAELTYLD